jgi:hypothetical protein
LGIWKNYDELEDNLSVDELLSTLNAHRKSQREQQRFFAAIQGIDLSDDEPRDLAELAGADAAVAGFGVGMGIGHARMEVVES